MYLLVDELAKALGIPKGTTRAVLTLEPGMLPIMELTMHVQDGKGGFLLEEFKDSNDTVVKRLAQVQFMIRLEPYPD